MKFCQTTTNLKRVSFTPFKLIPFSLCLLTNFLAPEADAQTNYYFHINGTGPGYGINANDNLSWDTTSWATNATGAPVTDWATYSTLGNPGFPRFNSTTTPYTVTVNNTDYIAGMFGGSGVTITINAAGGGNLYVPPNSTLSVGLPVQGFFTGGGTLLINAPISGTGGVGENAGGGNLELLGHNTYSGGTVFNSSGTLTYFKYNDAFGTGPICLNGTSFAPILGTGAATITLGNTWTNIGACGVNFAADANTPVVLNGVWTMTGNLSLRNNGVSTSPLTLNGPIRGAFNVTLSANNSGKITLNGASTYTGKTSVGVSGQSSGVTLSVSSINRVSGGNPSSNLGAPTTAANGTIGIGIETRTCTLIYTGAGETSDRIIDLAGQTGGAIIQADGTGALVLTNVNTASVAGAKTLTLQGANTSSNSIGKIVNSSSGATSVTKAQAGMWVMTGANTYSGVTTVNAGILQVSGSVAGGVTVNSGSLTNSGSVAGAITVSGGSALISGSAAGGVAINSGTVEVSGSVASGVTNTGGTLTLDTSSAITANATLAVSSGTTVNLNFAGTDGINSLIIDGTPQESGVWGPVGSSAPPTHQSVIFTGTGLLNVLGKPVIVQQPVSGTVFPDSTFSFTVGVAGDLSTLTYQWKQNGINVPDATNATYTISPVEAANQGVYSCYVTNNFGWTNTLNATLLVLGTNSYTAAVVGDGPVSFWRLDETNGPLAWDAIGGNFGKYVNVALSQPGYALSDPDTSIGLPVTNTARGFVQVTNYVPFTFGGASAFTLEAWVNFTNVSAGVQRIFSTFSGSSPSWGYAFGIKDPNTLRFTTSTVQDADQSLSHALVAGLWYHIVCTSSGGQYHFYVNGAEAGSGINIIGSGNTGVSVPLQLGANPGSYPAAEQVNGRIDEVAIYNYALNAGQVTNHYIAAFGTLTVSTPVALPPTNYVNLSASIQAVATGQGLSYQWYKGTTAPAGTPLSDGGNISGSTSDTLTISPLSLSDGTNYWVQVSNPSGPSNSPSASLVVLPIPTSSAQLNLTNGLVVHLPFDSDYVDISGHNNSGTNVGATYLTNAAAVGTHSLHYFTDTGASSSNYVTLGVRPDLQFSSNVNFTVAFWVRQPAGSTFTNLPFFADAIGSTAHGGFAFAPYNGTGGGGFIWTVGTVTSPNLATTFPDVNLINDGNWHHLVHVADRNANCTTYIDGTQVDSQSIVMSVVGNINTPNAATIGQDPTGTYPVTAEAELDDLGVWRRTLSPLEISGIYLAGASNSVSFAPVVNNAPAPAPTTISNIIGTTLTYGGGAGSQFVLLGTNNLAAPVSTWPRLATNSVTPGTFTIPAVGSAPATYYRIKSE